MHVIIDDATAGIVLGVALTPLVRVLGHSEPVAVVAQPVAVPFQLERLAHRVWRARKQGVAIGIGFAVGVGFLLYLIIDFDKSK